MARNVVNIYSPYKSFISDWVMTYEEAYQQYKLGHSLSEVGVMKGVTRQSVYQAFKNRGFALRPREIIVTEYNGENYGMTGDGYFRKTIGNREHLQRQMWIDVFGAIPEGHHVYFKDGNRFNITLSNLDCKPLSEFKKPKVTLYGPTYLEP